MSGNSDKLSQFWQELKRRRVVHVITIYASAAFVIIELAGNLSDPLNLPARLQTIIVIILAVGFPLVIIASWLYDLSAGRVERTPSLSELNEEKDKGVPNAWKIATYVSFLVIIGLVTFNLTGNINTNSRESIQSLVILPFDNFTGDDELEYFVSGMHSSLISDMGKISGLRVISKTSSKVYKDVDMTASEIAAELNVEGVVETDVICLGDSICIQFRLVSTSGDENPLWIADYKEEKSQILNLYNKVTREIAEEIRVELTEGEKELLTVSRTVDKEAYDAFLKSHQYWDDLHEESLYKTLDYLNESIEIDPGWAPPYAGLAKVWVGMLTLGFASPEEASPKINEYITKALELDPDLPDLHFTLGIIAVWTNWNWEEGEKEFLKALAINPNDAMSRTYYAHLLSILQRNEEALAQGQLAVDLDPMNPLIHGMYAGTLICTGNVEASLHHIEKALAIDPNNYFAYSIMEMVAIQAGQYDKVFEAFRYVLPLNADDFNTIEEIKEKQGGKVAYENAVTMLGEIAKEHYIIPFDMAIRCNHASQTDKALDWLDKAFDIHDATLPYLATGYGNFKQLHDNPRFTSILEKMDLPPPRK
jgi:TolB-like protein/Flp pilus assembly protein TadD